jgi:hypothetical protein
VNSGRTGVVDPEFYLRMLGERRLITGTHEYPGIGTIASAFCATGLLSSEISVRIVADYALATQLRQPAFGGATHGFQPAQTELPAAPAQPVVARCSFEAESPGSNWPYAVLGDTYTEIATSYNGPSNWDLVAKRFPKPQGFPQSLQLTDDTGHTASAMLQGSSDPRFTFLGRFASSSPMSRTTEWLELGGLRIQLMHDAPKPPPSVEPLPRTTPAVDFLRHRLASAEGPIAEPEQDPVVAALIATGALDPDEGLFRELNAISWHRTFGPYGRVNHPGHQILSTAATPSAGNPDDLPEPWASLMRPVDWSGPEGVITIGVATPLMEGAAAVLFALTSEPDRFRVDTLECGASFAVHLAEDKVETTPSFAWWAQDDRGGWYLGAWETTTVNEKGRRGDVTFHPPLDPRARSLRICPTLRRTRAVIDLELTWEPSP